MSSEGTCETDRFSRSVDSEGQSGTQNDATPILHIQPKVGHSTSTLVGYQQVQDNTLLSIETFSA